MGLPKNSLPPKQSAAARLSVEMKSEEIETLIVTAAQPLLSEHRVSISHAKLNMMSLTDRVLEADLKLRAHRGIAAAKLQIAAQLIIDGELIARLGRLEVSGRGVLGRLVASFIQPHVASLLTQSWPLSSLTPTGMCVTDVAMQADLAGLHIKVDALMPPFGPSQTRGKRPAMIDNPQAAATSKTATASKTGRLEIFVIDSGRDEAAKHKLDEHLALFATLLEQHILYRLSEEQSKVLLEENPSLIGADPVLVICDNDARLEKPRQGYGCRLCLGAMTSAVQDQMLKCILRIVCDRSKTKKQILRQIRKESTKEGFDGAMELLGEVVRPE